MRHGEQQGCERREHATERRRYEQEQERLSSGATASTSGTDASTAGTKRSVDQRSSSCNKSSGSSIQKGRQQGLLHGLSSKHDAMILNLAIPSLLSLAADPLLAITGGYLKSNRRFRPLLCAARG